MGISTDLEDLFEVLASLWSQSLSGWDGDFHREIPVFRKLLAEVSQSLSGWDGDFHCNYHFTIDIVISTCRNPFQGGMGISTFNASPGDDFSAGWVAIPFRVGWGFPLPRDEGGNHSVDGLPGRNPFQGGMGISTSEEFAATCSGFSLSQSLSGWDGDFHSQVLQGAGLGGRGNVAIPFRVGWGFPRGDREEHKD